MLGFVVCVVDDEALAAEARSLALSIAAGDSRHLQNLKALFDGGYGLPFAEALAFEVSESHRLNGEVVIGTGDRS